MMQSLGGAWRWGAGHLHRLPYDGSFTNRERNTGFRKPVALFSRGGNRGSTTENPENRQNLRDLVHDMPLTERHEHVLGPGRYSYLGQGFWASGQSFGGYPGILTHQRPGLRVYIASRGNSGENGYPPTFRPDARNPCSMTAREGLYGYFPAPTCAIGPTISSSHNTITANRMWAEPNC